MGNRGVPSATGRGVASTGSSRSRRAGLARHRILAHVSVLRQRGGIADIHAHQSHGRRWALSRFLQDNRPHPPPPTQPSSVPSERRWPLRPDAGLRRIARDDGRHDEWRTVGAEMRGVV
jgi:hypothetical protein